MGETLKRSDFLRKCPWCEMMYEECFAFEKGKCTILMDTKSYAKKCPFMKTREQVQEELAYCRERLDALLKDKEANNA